jgi:membrane protein YqaA with SNARE-associated domain
VGLISLINRIRGWSKSLYIQAQRWGKSKNCIRDLTAITFISSTIIPLPVEAFLIAIITAAPRRWWRATLAATAGTVLGGLVCYLVGRMMLGQAAALAHYISPNTNWLHIQESVNRDGMLFLAVSAFTPGLFRIGMVAAGVVGFNPFMFAIAVAIGRGIRLFLEAGLLRIFGKKLQLFLENYFDLLTLGIGAAAFLLLIMIKFVKS